MTYGRDDMGRIRDITSALGSEQTTLLSNALYEPFGPARSWTLGTGSGAMSVTETHDAAYRVDSIQHGNVLNLSYTGGYDAADNLQHIQDVAGTDTKDFSYDYLNRLSSESTTAIRNLGYDAVGNRNAAGSIAYGYYASNKNWLLWLSPPTGISSDSWGFAYDAAGRVQLKIQLQAPSGKTAESFVYGYGDNGRQTVIQHNYSVPAGTAAVSDFTVTGHNAFGQPVYEFTTQNPGSSPVSILELFSYDQAGNLLDLWTTASQQTAQEYVYFDGRPIAYYNYTSPSSIAGPYYIHGDHLGTPQKVTDSAGAMVASMRYSAFGERTLVSNTVAPPRLGFPGQFSSYTGWFSFNHFREYDPTLGRYLEVDPIGLAGGINPYLYADANPLKNTDPDGKKAQAADDSFGRQLLVPSSDTSTLNPSGAKAGGGESKSKDSKVCFSGDLDCESERHACHTICVAECVGRGLGSDAPGCYRRCVRGCLPFNCADDF